MCWMVHFEYTLQLDAAGFYQFTQENPVAGCHLKLKQNKKKLACHFELA